MSSAVLGQLFDCLNDWFSMHYKSKSWFPRSKIPKTSPEFINYYSSWPLLSKRLDSPACECYSRNNEDEYFNWKNDGVGKVLHFVELYFLNPCGGISLRIFFWLFFAIAWRYFQHHFALLHILNFIITKANSS